MAAHNSAFELQLIGGNPYVSIFSEDLNKIVGITGGDDDDDDDKKYFSDETFNDEDDSRITNEDDSRIANEDDSRIANDNPLSTIFGGDDDSDNEELKHEILKGIFVDNSEEEDEDELIEGGDDIEQVDDLTLF